MRTLTVALLTSSVLLCMPPRTANAATISGRVHVRNSDDILPGAEVTLSGGGITGSRTVTADDHGVYRFIGVPFGSHYILKAELAGLQPWPMYVDYVYQEDRVTADLTLDVTIAECSLGRYWQIPQTFAAPGTFRLRSDELRYLP